MAMETQVVPAGELSEEHLRCWSAIQESDPGLDSPFFRPEFTRIVAAARNDVEVAVLQTADGPVGFVPFQRYGSSAQAVSGRLSEFHGAICRPGVDWSAHDVLERCGLRAWPFDHLPADQPWFQPHAWGRSASPYIDLQGGYEAYLSHLKSEQTATLGQLQRKMRKLGREIGPLRLELHSTSEDVFRSFLEFKSLHYRRTGVLNVFEYAWVPDMLRRLRDCSGDGFSGCLAALYAGERLVATTFGLRSRQVYHSWFPTYDQQLSRYSPGLIQFLLLAQSAADAGIRRIDLGKGEERYKRQLQSGSIAILEGAVDLRPVQRRIKHQWYRVKRWIRSSPYRDTLEWPLIATRYFRQWYTFR